jgi:Family of unknown function (DUF6011)
MTSMAGRLETPEAASKFLFAGNATLTLKSKKTGDRFTYKVEATDDKKCHFASVLVGPENTTDFKYFGYFRNDNFNYGKAKAKVAEDAPSVRAFLWFVKQLDGLFFNAQLEVWHEGRCGRCGRKLTVPESVASGFGPECSGKVFKAEEV